MARTRAAIQAAQRSGMAERRQQVAALLRAQWQQSEIAARLGVSEATISGDAAALRAQWRAAAGADFAEVARGALAALDSDEVALRDMLTQNLSPRDRLGVYERLGAIQDRRAKWMGFDTPVRGAVAGDLVAALLLIDGEVVS